MKLCISLGNLDVAWTELLYLGQSKAAVLA